MWHPAAMNRFAPLAILLALGACSKQGEPAVDASAAASAAPSAEASDATAATTPAPKGPVSRYTSLKDCKLVEAREDEDWSRSRCKGAGGVDLMVEYADARDDLQVLRADQPGVTLGLPYVAGGGFNTLGDTVEWRGTGEGAQFAPRMLIVRNSSVQNPERPEHSAAFLDVIDLAQGCAVAHVKPGPGQNEAARAAADGPALKCLRPGEVQR